ncbi:MAG TPA: cell envelope integrity EipB family protein [Xanthobacteraceae bacterium]|nr:cell envelope integrity EipB family protein [Xanthobacteraceae bacterium]
MRILQKAFVALLPAVLLAHASAAAPTDARGSILLAPHRAIYDLSLAQSRRNRSLEAVRGRILYDFSGSACEGYTLQFRQVTQLDSGEGKYALSDLRTENWEAGDGASFRFSSRNFLNNDATEASEGTAERHEAAVTVTLKRPTEKTFEIKDVVFPSDQMRRIITAARAGTTLLQLGVYDGSDSGEKIYNTLTVIGQPVKSGERPPAGAVDGEKALAGLVRWPVTVSYFDRAKAGVDQTPLYSISFELYENGIARALKLDYGDFVLSGAMTSLEVKTAKPCP